MKNGFDGNAIVYCQGAFNTTNGKTAHGLVRFTRRYRVLSVVDSSYAGRDAGEVIDGRAAGIPVLSSIDEAIATAAGAGTPASRLVVGLAPDGGRLPAGAREDVLHAVRAGLGVDCGLHDFLSDDPEIAAAAETAGVHLRDIRKVPREGLHFFTGKIEEVTATRIAVLGTDSAVGKRTTAWILLDALERRGYRTELVGTGQTAWMQGATHCIIFDSIVNDFVSGEIEHAVWSAWNDTGARVVIIEGQGSLMNPAYPGGFEILAAGRPHAVILQHAPARVDYDGFPGYPIQPIEHQIRAIEVVSEKPVVAVAVNHEDLDAAGIETATKEMERRTGLPAADPLVHGAETLVDALVPVIEGRAPGARAREERGT